MSSDSLDDDSDGEQAESSAGHGAVRHMEADLEHLILNSAPPGRLNTAGLYRMPTPQAESSAENELDAALTSSDALLGASFDASLPLVDASDALLGLQALNHSHSTSFNFASSSADSDLSDDSHSTSFNFNLSSADSDLSDADPAAFDYNAFNAVISDPNFDISILNTPGLPDFIPPPLDHSQGLPMCGDAGTDTDGDRHVPPAQYPEVFLPPVPHADLEDTGPTNEEARNQCLLPPGNKTRGAKRTRPLAAPGPLSSMDEVQSAPAPPRRVHKPFNARERDNDFGAPTK